MSLVVGSSIACELSFTTVKIALKSKERIAFSKRKVCNGENFRIKDFDESQNNRFFKNVCMYVCMKPNFIPVITLERMNGIS